MTSPIASAPLSFRKMNGLGNEIVVVDLRGHKRFLSADEVRAVAADPLSRFDQMMVLHDPITRGTDAFIRIYNTDGSEARACGNGMRCVGWWSYQAQKRARMQFETRPGVLDVVVADQDHITVDMGEPRFAWDEIPLAEPFHDTKRIELQIGPIDAPVLHSPSVVNVGNPHCIFWVDDVAPYDLGRFGPLLENHPIFPDRANISLAAVTSRTSINVRTWERGAGLTRACGSAACAAGVLGARTGRTERRVTVNLPGGPLVIEWTASNRILMTGPATDEYPGVFDFERVVAQRLS
jgi:diaminopimelate epimerase